jgi:prepilin-type N-terminal cleavage/methylation domain-containing protein
MGNFRQKTAAGFTLIELLVVIAIVGILAAVTVPAVSSARDRGQSAATSGEVAAYQEASSMFLAATGAYPVPDAADIPGSCLEYDGTSGAPTNPRFCCVADQPCTYAGRTLAPLSRGAFAPNGAGGSRAGLLGGAIARLPRLPPRPIASASLQYQGVFHSCNDAACQRPTVAWTQPTSCPSGMTRNGVSGFCQASIDRSVVNVIGQSETYCYNGVDDDGDDDVDCLDSDCAARAKCGAEDTQERCFDEFDNDGDGDSDCNDSDCALIEGCNDVAFESECEDGEDNDLDGFADCADLDCDGYSNEGGQECEAYEEVSCTDTFDNDGDSFADCEDMGCSAAPACRPACVPSSLNESDCSFLSGDEDCDGDQNCADSDCSYQGICGGTEVGFCNDGLDNDGDGSYDCYPGDGDCVGGPECE